MIKLVTLALLLVSVSAFATGGKSRLDQVDWEELKDRCTNPVQGQRQIAPSNITLLCEDVKTLWRPVESENSMTLPTSRVVTSEVLSNKYEVKSSTQGLEGLAAYTPACPLFEEYRRVVAVEKVVSCDEVAAFEGTVTEFCLAHAAEVERANPDAAIEEATGRKFSPCHREE